VDLWSCYL